MSAGQPFLWNQIESADYREYVANLRAIGCPEQLVRDLVTAELNQLFAPRISRVWPQRCPLYWQKGAREEPSSKQAEQLQALQQEQAGLFKQITGAIFDPQSFIDVLFLQVWGVEQELLFLSTDKQQAARDALLASELQQKFTSPRPEDQDYLHSEEYFEDKCKVLATVLTAAEMEEYRLRNSQQVVSLRYDLQYFECTPAEFKALLEWRTQNIEARRRYGDPAADVAEARSLFGEERAKEFVRVTDHFFINARRTAEECGLAVEAAERAWQITSEARAAARQLADDRSLSNESRKQNLVQLLQEADAGIKQLLGEKPSRSLRRDLATVLRPFEGSPTCCGCRE